ncbi:hypothetical protein [Amycolatopsis thailandensis]|uniref:hypothetical protein n=1 Tax=Amycolatopsis thailandensis TaxID=589330 RepID=UPI00362A6C5D
MDPTFTYGVKESHSYRSDGTNCDACGLRIGNSQAKGDTYNRSVFNVDYTPLLGKTADILAHPVHQKLVHALADRRSEVRVAAARALGALGDHESLRKHRHALRGEQAELDQILNGQIPPLDSTWPLDNTT